ncbi:MAG TPA: hypothetical protein VEB20_07655 [Azospirillaceae bacterium]|nr:hypothetical protein [Azospirillaceae bacterium]
MTAETATAVTDLDRALSLLGRVEILPRFATRVRLDEAAAALAEAASLIRRHDTVRDGAD